MYIIDLIDPFLCKIGPWRQSQLLLAGLGFVSIKIAWRKFIEISWGSDFLLVANIANNPLKNLVRHATGLEQAPFPPSKQAGQRDSKKQQDSRAVFNCVSSGLHRLQLLFPAAPDKMKSWPIEPRL